MRGSQIGVTALVLGLFLGLLVTTIIWFTSGDTGPDRESPEVLRPTILPGVASRPPAVEAEADGAVAAGPGLEGRVVDTLDQPISDAEIEVYRDDLVLDSEAVARARSDERGFFRVGVPDVSRYLVRVAHPDFAPLGNRSGIYVEDREFVSLGLFTLQAGLVLQGRVLDPRGRVVSDVEVLLRPDLRSERSEHGFEIKRLRANANGSFRFSALAARTYRLHVVADAPWADLVVSGLSPRLPDEDGVELRLERGHPLRGVVVDESARPVSAARVFASSVESTSARTHETRTGSSGGFEFERLRAGEWQLDVRHGTRVSTVTLSVPADDCRVTLSAGQNLRLQLVAAELPPKLRWRLTWPDGGDARSPWQSSAIENESSMLRDLPPYEVQADYDVELRVAGFARQFLAMSQLTTGAPVRLAREATLRVRLERTEAVAASAPEEYRLRSLREPQFIQSARLDRQDRLRFSQLPAGTYTLEDARNGEPLLEVRLDVGSREDLALRWPPSRGKLIVDIAPEASTDSAVELHVWSLTGGFRDLRSAPAGAALSFPGLRVGRYGLRLRSSSDAVRSSAPTSTLPSTRADVPTKIVEVLANLSVRVRLP